MATHIILIHDYLLDDDDLWGALELWMPESTKNPGSFKTSSSAKRWVSTMTKKSGWHGVSRWHIVGPLNWTVYLEH